MRAVRGVVLALLVLPVGGMLAGCDSLDTFQIFDSKKKLPGERVPVFPNGVPGVTQGIPPELMKGYQEQPSPDPAAAAAQAPAEKNEPRRRPPRRRHRRLGPTSSRRRSPPRNPPRGRGRRSRSNSNSRDRRAGRSRSKQARRRSRGQFS
jgi:hypothetical protein